MLNYHITVEDSGELKTVTPADIRVHDGDGIFAIALNDILNAVLDRRSILAGEYDPSTNDDPIELVGPIAQPAPVVIPETPPAPAVDPDVPLDEPEAAVGPEPIAEPPVEAAEKDL